MGDRLSNASPGPQPTLDLSMYRRHEHLAKAACRCIKVVGVDRLRFPILVADDNRQRAGIRQAQVRRPWIDGHPPFAFM